MTDLTKLMVPFGLLDEAYGAGTAEALRAHGGPYERFAGAVWVDDDDFVFVNDITYRVKPQPSAPREIWVNEYAHGIGSGAFVSKEEADKFGGFDRIACRRFREVTE